MTDAHQPLPLRWVPTTTIGRDNLPDYANGPVATHGYIGDSGAVAEVRAALAVLDAARAHLSAFTSSGHCVTEGAYLDPLTRTRQVILSMHTCHFDHLVPLPPGVDRLARVQARREAVATWEQAFRAAGWGVEYYIAEPIPRLTLTPPAS